MSDDAVIVLRRAFAELDAAEGPRGERQRPRGLHAADRVDVPVGVLPDGTRFFSRLKSEPGRVEGRVVALAHDDELPILHCGIVFDGQIGAWPCLWRLNGCGIVKTPATDPGCEDYMQTSLVTPGWYTETGLQHLIYLAVRRSRRVLLHLHATRDSPVLQHLAVGAMVQIDLAIADMYVDVAGGGGQPEQVTKEIPGECWHAWPRAIFRL